MILRDFGQTAAREWFQQILSWSRKKITFDDNMDCQILRVKIGTGETQISHALGRVPVLILEAAAYPGGTAGITFTNKAPTVDTLWLKRSVDGECTLILM